MSPDESLMNNTARAAGSPALNGVIIGGSPGLPGDPQTLEEVIAERRASLAATIDELVVRAHPKEVARRSVADAKDRAWAFARTPGGELRTERLAAVAGAAVVLVGLVVVLRTRLGRAR
ncbi:MAG: hypothetical protein QG622_1716 [Actinomycetota bacterium]|nr:hypothetical protein [Actinomycetota bacterium]